MDTGQQQRLHLGLAKLVNTWQCYGQEECPVLLTHWVYITYIHIHREWLFL